MTFQRTRSVGPVPIHRNRDAQNQCECERKCVAGTLLFTALMGRTLKLDHANLHPASDGLYLYRGEKDSIHYYNHNLHHQIIVRSIPA